MLIYVFPRKPMGYLEVIMYKRSVLIMLFMVSGLLVCSKKQKIPIPDLATRRLFNLKDTLKNSTSFEGKLQLFEKFGDQELGEVLSPSKQSDPKIGNALKTISKYHYFFEAGKEQKEKYLEFFPLDMLLDLIEAMAVLGFKQLKDERKLLEARLEKLIPSLVNFFSYGGRILKAFEYLERDRVATLRYKTWFKDLSGDYKQIRDIVEHIAPFLESSISDHKKKYKLSTADQVVVDVLNGVGPAKRALLSLHENLDFFITNNPEIYLQQLPLQELLTLIKSLKYFHAEKLGDRALALQEALVGELKSGEVTKLNYPSIIRAFEYLERENPVTTNKPFFTLSFIGNNRFGACFSQSGNNVMFSNVNKDCSYPLQRGVKTVVDALTDEAVMSPDANLVAQREWYRGYHPPALAISYAGERWSYDFVSYLNTYVFSAASKTIYLGFGVNFPLYNKIGCEGCIKEMDFSGDIKRIFIDPETGAKKSAHEHAISIIAVSPDGKYFASSAEEDPVVKLWDVTTGELSLKFDAEVGQPTCIAISADGTRIAIGSKSGLISLWDNKGKKLGIINVKRPVYWLDWHPDKTLLLVGSHAADGSTSLGDVSLYSVADKKLRMIFKHIFPDNAVDVKPRNEKAGTRVLFSPDGHYFLASDPKQVTVWEVPPKIWLRAKFPKFVPKEKAKPVT